MKTRIAKTFTFDAAHFLPHVSDGHKCKRVHGHTYRVEVVLEGIPDERGMIRDYEEISIVWRSIEQLVDHRLLNDVPGLENPTTEILAPFLFHLFKAGLPEVVSVRVYESSTTWCEVTP